MNATTFFGYKCPICNSKVTVGAIVGGSEIRCPSCNAPMVPDEEGQASAANVYCPKCNAQFGLVTSDRCPICGGPFSKIP
jgi:rubrerythrin